jgi:pimeloyl-ACP methyl ester carboxylesterase
VADALKGSATPDAVQINTDSHFQELFEAAASEEYQVMFSEKRGSGPPVVLVHGLGAYSFSWRYMVAALSEHYTTYAVDLLGFGLDLRVARWLVEPSEFRYYT